MQWKIIEGFSKYEVSDTGIVRRVSNGKELAFSYSKRPTNIYSRVTLFKDGVRYYKQVHRLVAEAFIPNPNKLPQVDHINNNGLDNRVTNLQWVTASENIVKSFKDNKTQKLLICSSGGLQGSKVLQARAEKKYRTLLGDKFYKFFPGGTICKDAAITYQCDCGIKRTVSIQAKELRVHNGKCPICTNTINRSRDSLL